MRTPILLLSALLLGSANAQVNNARIVSVHITGNCGMCKKTIEAAALVKHEAMAEWNSDTKLATITYDSTRTDEDAVLKRIALAGYDNASYLAPDAAYAALPGCCQYDRTLKKAPVAAAEVHDHTGHQVETDQVAAPATADPLAPVFTAYFKLKDALVASDAAQAKDKAAALKNAMDAVNMSALDHDVHTVWMRVMGPLADLSGAIANTVKLDEQRKAFMQLTTPLAELAKAAPGAVPVYLAHCPMYQGGADWLSLEKEIKNPFYGSMMLTCGSVKETIVK
jgi:copper chaperone CopZ